MTVRTGVDMGAPGAPNFTPIPRAGYDQTSLVGMSVYPRARNGQWEGPPIPIVGLAPVITIVTTPLPPSTRNTPIVVTITPQAGVPLRKAWIDVHYPGIIGDEAVYTSTRFGAYYTNGVNTRTTLVGGGYQFTILRDGGWPIGSFPLATSFDIFAVDTNGNSTVP